MGPRAAPSTPFDVKGDASGLAFSVPQGPGGPPPQVQLSAHLRDWEQAAHSMRVSAFGNNEPCSKPFHLLKTCASRVDSLSEHVLTKKPTVLTSPSNVNRTKRPSASSMDLMIERYNVHYSVALKEPRLPALNMRAAYCLHPPIFQLQTACVRLYRAPSHHPARHVQVT